MKTTTKTTDIIKAIDDELKTLLLNDLREVRSRSTNCKTPLAA